MKDIGMRIGLFAALLLFAATPAFAGVECQGGACKGGSGNANANNPQGAPAPLALGAPFLVAGAGLIARRVLRRRAS